MQNFSTFFIYNVSLFLILDTIVTTEHIIICNEVIV